MGIPLPRSSGRTLMRRGWKIRDQNLLLGTGAPGCGHVQHEAANTKGCLVRFLRHRTRKFLECGEGLYVAFGYFSLLYSICPTNPGAEIVPAFWS